MATTRKAPAASAKPDKATKPTTTAAPRQRRKNLSPAEKIAKLEADLAKAREKADESNSKKANELREHRAKIEQKVNEGRAKMAEIDTELERLAIPVTNVDPDDVSHDESGDGED